MGLGFDSLRLKCVHNFSNFGHYMFLEMEGATHFYFQYLILCHLKSYTTYDANISNILEKYSTLNNTNCKKSILAFWDNTHPHIFYIFFSILKLLPVIPILTYFSHFCLYFWFMTLKAPSNFILTRKKCAHGGWQYFAVRNVGLKVETTP